MQTNLRLLEATGVKLDKTSETLSRDWVHSVFIGHVAAEGDLSILHRDVPSDCNVRLVRSFDSTV